MCHHVSIFLPLVAAPREHSHHCLSSWLLIYSCFLFQRIMPLPGVVISCHYFTSKRKKCLSSYKTTICLSSHLSLSLRRPIPIPSFFSALNLHSLPSFVFSSSHSFLYHLKVKNKTTNSGIFLYPLPSLSSNCNPLLSLFFSYKSATPFLESIKIQGVFWSPDFTRQ